MDLRLRYTLILLSQDVYKIINTGGLCQIMETLVEQFSSAITGFNKKQAITPIYSGSYSTLLKAQEKQFSQLFKRTIYNAIGWTLQDSATFGLFQE